MLDKVARAARGALLALASNEALFLFSAFLTQLLMGAGPLKWYREQIGAVWASVIVPWGAALCLLRLERCVRRPAPERADVRILFVLLAWIVAPFCLRFGPTNDNVTSWYNHAVVFFGLYAFVSDEDAPRLDHLVDLSSALFAALSAALAVPALYAALTDTPFGTDTGEIVFGLEAPGFLSFGVHYNITGMFALCCALLALPGFFRRKNPLVKLAHLVPSALMLACLVLTQSRTSRYAMLLAGAACLFGWLFGNLPLQKRAPRIALALLAALLSLPAGYMLTRAATDTALAHIADVRTRRLAAETAATPALPEEAPATKEAPIAEEALVQAEAPAQLETPAPAVAAPVEQRSPVDATFSDRTRVWGNLFALWRSEPKSLLIGNGIGRTGRRIVAGTIHEADGSTAVHNTYLQFAADYGLIGLALMAAFLCLLAGPCLRALFAPRGAAVPGDRALVGMVVGALAVGMMESQPLGAMMPINLALFYALAVLKGRDRAATANA